MTSTESQFKKWRRSKKSVFYWQKFQQECHLKLAFHGYETGCKSIFWKCFVKNCWAKQLTQSSDFFLSWFLHVWTIWLSRNLKCKQPLRIWFICIVLLYSLIFRWGTHLYVFLFLSVRLSCTISQKPYII